MEAVRLRPALQQQPGPGEAAVCDSAFDSAAIPCAEDSRTRTPIPLRSIPKQLAQAKLINWKKVFLVLGQGTAICVCASCVLVRFSNLLFQYSSSQCQEQGIIVLS